MTRFQALHREIQEIKRCNRKGHRVKGKWEKAKKLGSNAALAHYCGVKDDVETHRWFWRAAPKRLPKATMTLRALRWVCVVRGQPVDLIPDWDALWFCFSFVLCSETHNLRAAQQKAGYSNRFPKLYVEGEAAQTASKRYGITSRSVKNYAQYPWSSGKSTRTATSPEPDGNFALEVLAEQLSQNHFVGYLTFLELDLPKFPYHEIPRPMRAQTEKGHLILAQTAAEYWEYFTTHQRDEKKLYSYFLGRVPVSLRRILF